jgi:hypothetical protein
MQWSTMHVWLLEHILNGEGIMMTQNEDSVCIEIREASQCWRWSLADGWDATTLIASLSSDPRSFRELALAWLRYRSGEPLDNFFVPCPREEAEGSCEEAEGSCEEAEQRIAGTFPPESGNWLVIDLDHQLVWTNNEDETLISFEPGEYVPNEEDGGEAGLVVESHSVTSEEFPFAQQAKIVSINLPPHWQIQEGAAWGWGTRPPKTPYEPIDVRGVLYGRSMAEFFAEKLIGLQTQPEFPRIQLDWSDFEEACERIPLATNSAATEEAQILAKIHRLTVQVHAEWLTTSLDALDQQSPRYWLHKDRKWADREIESRQSQWTRDLQMPRPLDRDTYAYIYGPFSTTEVIVYFELCRSCLRYGWIRIQEDPAISIDALANAIYEHSKNFLIRQSPDPELPSPGKLIELSRRHMPVQAEASGSEADCDCPICKAMLENPQWFGPSFLCFTGEQLEMDSEFAFSLFSSQDDFEVWQRSGVWEEDDVPY